MRFLIVGAGALGGYFGGRLLEAGQDATFLVRARRAGELARDGLIIRSSFGDLVLPDPPHVLASDVKSSFDVVVVGCKAYDLDETMEAFAAAVGPQTAILPLLNGMAHLDRLSARFGAERVLGGQCVISAALDAAHAIVHLNNLHTLGFGELDGRRSERVEAIALACGRAKFDARASTEILQDMWEKWVFIAAAAGITCLMRASIGDIVAAGGADLSLRLFEECSAIATQAGFAPRAASRERGHGVLAAAGSPLTASMLKDIERNAPTEGAHILDDLISRAPAALPEGSVLRMASIHLKAFAARRQRELASNAAA